MTEGEPSKVIFFDTNALRSLKFETYIASLLNACKDQKISLCICDCVIYERARQYYRDCKEKSIIPPDRKLIETYAWFKKLFEAYQVTVIESNNLHIKMASEFLKDDETYFKNDNPNDHRDALIFSIANSELKVDQSIILCEEKNLRTLFE